MKPMAAWILTAALAVGLVLPAGAAETGQDAQLSQVTQKVKETLELDTSGYDSFSGECYDQRFVTQWSLRWEGDQGQLSIDALEDGTVVGYYLDREEGTQTGLPAYPQGDSAQALAAAQDFLDKALTPGLETAVLEESQSQQLGRNEYRFNGGILFHGLPSPLTCTVEVDGESGLVTYFYRDISYGMYVGEVPDAKPAVGQDAAAQTLKGSLSLKLEYVLPEDGSGQAVLRYVPDSRDEYYVDAQTGALVNLTELERNMGNKGMGAGGSGEDSAASESAPTANGSLSQAEQEGIQKLEGVLSSQSLDGQLRGEERYGLSGYTLDWASYRLVEDQEEGAERVLCTLRYLRPGEGASASRTFTVDARTGQVEELWSYLPWYKDSKAAVTQTQAQEKAEEFLDSFCPDYAAGLALYEGPEGESGSQYRFTFARQVNGSFFPEQFYQVNISAQDGSVCGLFYQYDPSVTFDSPDGIITPQQAQDAWMGTYTVTLGYLQVPEKLEAGDPQSQLYLQLGMESFYALKLGYGLEREADYSYLGVDGKTGQVVRQESGSESWLTYSDLSGHWAREAIEALAQYSVGYDGGTFAPGQAMTQFDLVALLFSVERYPLNPDTATQEERNTAYSAAYRMGALTPEERRDDAVLTRAQAVKLLLNAEGLKNAAQLTGIYTCTYTDRSAIPAGDLGYAALAEGIGMVQGTWAGDRAATRGEGAVMLHRLLSW